MRNNKFNVAKCGPLQRKSKIIRELERETQLLCQSYSRITSLVSHIIFSLSFLRNGNFCKLSIELRVCLVSVLCITSIIIDISHCDWLILISLLLLKLLHFFLLSLFSLNSIYTFCVFLHFLSLFLYISASSFLLLNFRLQRKE